MTSGNIIRVEKPEKYAIVSQDMLRDSRLSFAARGLLAYLLSKPANWSMQTEDLISQSPAGRDAIYSMLKELETCSYLKRERVRDEKGHVHWETTVYELPELAEPNTAFPDTAQPDTVKPDTVRPNTEKPHYKNYVEEELSKKKKDIVVSHETTPNKPSRIAQAVEAFNYWKEVHAKNGRTIFDPKRRRAVEARLKDYDLDFIKSAIRGIKRDPYCSGKNEQHKIYDDLELICRDSKHIEDFAALDIPQNGNSPPKFSRIDACALCDKDGWRETGEGRNRMRFKCKHEGLTDESKHAA